MKFSKIIVLSLGMLSVASVYLSCSKDTPKVAANRGVNLSSTLQVFNATVKAARNYVYVDGVPVSGAALAYQGVFPATAYSFNVGAGTHTFLIKDTLPTTTQVPITFTQTLEVGKDYTVFTYDTTTSAKQLTVLNNLVIPSDTTCMLRFANFVYNPTAVPNVDVYSFRRIPGTPVFVSTPVLNNANIPAPSFAGSVPVFSNVATTEVTSFIPYASALTDTLYVFASGTSSPLLAKGFVTSLTPTRSYTSVYNGSYRGALATRAVTTFATY